jgi:D-galactarolactone cycloisomerase
MRHRDYTLVNIRTAGGLEGWAYVWGVPVVKTLIDSVLKDIVVGQSAYARQKIWADMFKAVGGWDRGGIAMRAISAIDIALWDILGKAAGMPICRLLAHAGRARLPTTRRYYPGPGRPRVSCWPAWRRSCGRARDKGFFMFKIKVGGAPESVDVQRVALARR